LHPALFGDAKLAGQVIENPQIVERVNVAGHRTRRS
jgi:hypothetical protein